MKRFTIRTSLVGSIALMLMALSLSAPTHAAAILKMDLGEMTDRADRVFRGTVLSIEPGTVQIGGGEMATVTYEFAVSDYFKGSFDNSKGVPIARVTMLANQKGAVHNGPAMRLSVLPEMPTFEEGQEYVLFTTAPSAVGLSSTVGLDQGAFKVAGSASSGEQMTTNSLNNAGLFEGPIPYAQLANAIRELTSKNGGSLK